MNTSREPEVLCMRNYTVIGGDDIEYGPAPHAEIDAWITDGRLSVRSLCRPEGEDSWKPLAAFPEFEAAFEEQRRRFPAPIGEAQPPPLIPESLSTHSAPPDAPALDIGSCLSRSSQLLGANFGLLLGAVGVTWLFGLVAQLIPFLGGLVYVLLEGVLYGGLYLLYLRALRGEPVRLRTLFEVYGDGMGQLMIAGLIISVFTSLGFVFFIIPGLYLLVAWAFALPLVVDRKLEFWKALELSRKVATRIWFQLALLLLFAFLPLVITHVYAQVKVMMVAYPGMTELLQSGKPFDMQQLNNLLTEVARVSIPLALLNKLILLLNLPFATGALMFAYEDLFGKQRPKQD